jgi:chromate transporter
LNSSADRGTGARAPEHPAEVSIRELLSAFGTIGLTSFGGGVSGWIFREVVERRRWMSTADFLAGLSLARTMPGVNVVNLSIWIGYRLRRGRGAATALCGVFAGPLVLIIFCAMAYRRWGGSPPVHQVLLGITAAALALSLSMSVKALRATVTKPFPALIVVLIFVSVGILHWPMLITVAVLAPVSIAWTFFMDAPDEG